MSKARPLVVVGPSGVGKGTLIKLLRKYYGKIFGFSVSHTTRPMREGEEDGREYTFVTEEAFRQLITDNQFIEHANVHSNLYGTSFSGVAKVHEEGKICILEIDVQGAAQVKGAESLDPFVIFIKPPSMEELERRLRGRATDAEDVILERIANARTEMEFCDANLDIFDFVMVNDDLDEAFREFRLRIAHEYLLPEPPLCWELKAALIGGFAAVGLAFGAMLYKKMRSGRSCDD